MEEVIDDLVETLRTRHTRRLLDGKCTVYGGLGFLNSLTNIERIADQCSNLSIYTIALTDRRSPGRTTIIFSICIRATIRSSTPNTGPHTKNILAGSQSWTAEQHWKAPS